MVRRGNPLLIQGDTVVSFLNKVQKTAWKVNPFVADVAEELYERRIQVGKFIPIVEQPIPPKPLDIEENAESRKDYRRRAAEAHNLNAQAFRKSVRTRTTMEVMRMFRDKERFWTPGSLDYRGRWYPHTVSPHIQDTDFGKSLLQFADGAFMLPEGEDWLSFAVATTTATDSTRRPFQNVWNGLKTTNHTSMQLLPTQFQTLTSGLVQMIPGNTLQLAKSSMPYSLISLAALHICRSQLMRRAAESRYSAGSPKTNRRRKWSTSCQAPPYKMLMQ